MKEFLEALENHTTLAWTIKYAPDGGIDRALAAAWESSSDWQAMQDVLAYAYNFGPNPYGLALDDLLEACWAHSWPYTAPAADIANEIRKKVDAPTWEMFFS